MAVVHEYKCTGCGEIVSTQVTLGEASEAPMCPFALSESQGPLDPKVVHDMKRKFSVGGAWVKW